MISGVIFNPFKILYLLFLFNVEFSFIFHLAFHSFPFFLVVKSSFINILLQSLTHHRFYNFSAKKGFIDQKQKLLHHQSKSSFSKDFSFDLKNIKHLHSNDKSKDDFFFKKKKKEKKSMIYT